METGNGLQNIEKLGDTIITSRKCAILLDKKRNKCREALTAIKHNEKDHWMNFGNVFIKMAAENIRSSIKQEQTNTDQRINELYESISVNTNLLQKCTEENIQSIQNTIKLG
ncbi:unnamed protein product [Gordionus sp. m RMFG-2023]|uniref:uncharacterized protein LOC135927250 n=1 Tax=Gordionus sp. m RMFG-2023 TaxID=3053472 RepID=UPI0030E00FCF